jgi:hypothetical protein
VTRKLTDVLLAEIETAFPDNTQGLIQPIHVRTALQDLIDSLRPAWAAVIADHTATPVPFSTTSSWQKINTAGFYGRGGASDIAELNYDQLNGELIVMFGGYNHEVRGIINFAGASNVEYQFSVAVDGVPVGEVASVDGQGTGRIMQALDWQLLFPLQSQKLSFMVRSPGGNSTIQISQCSVYGTLNTTRFL